jgi:hypothetical protein
MEHSCPVLSLTGPTLFIDRTDSTFFDGEPLRALTTLSFSQNVDLQRSAALAFAEITERRKWRGWVIDLVELSY